MGGRGVGGLNEEGSLFPIPLANVNALELLSFSPRGDLPGW